MCEFDSFEKIYEALKNERKDAHLRRDNFAGKPLYVHSLLTPDWLTDTDPEPKRRGAARYVKSVISFQYGDDVARRVYTSLNAQLGQKRNVDDELLVQDLDIINGQLVGLTPTKAFRLREDLRLLMARSVDDGLIRRIGQYVYDDRPVLLGMLNQELALQGQEALVPDVLRHIQKLAHHLAEPPKGGTFEARGKVEEALKALKSWLEAKSVPQRKEAQNKLSEFEIWTRKNPTHGIPDGIIYAINQARRGLK